MKSIIERIQIFFHKPMGNLFTWIQSVFRGYSGQIKVILLNLGIILLVFLAGFRWPSEIAISVPASSVALSAIAQAFPTQDANLLTASDLPLGFQAFPDKWKTYTNRGVNTIYSYFKKSDITVDRYFAYVNLAAFELILGFTAPLHPQEIAAFDARLKRPQAGEQFVAGLKQSTEFLQPLQVKLQGNLTDLETIGNVATGSQFVMRFKGLPYPLFTDIVAFRRNQTAALLMVGSFGVPSRVAKVQSLAQLLDRNVQN